MNNKLIIELDQALNTNTDTDTDTNADRDANQDINKQSDIASTSHHLEQEPCNDWQSLPLEKVSEERVSTDKVSTPLPKQVAEQPDAVLTDSLLKTPQAKNTLSQEFLLKDSSIRKDSLKKEALSEKEIAAKKKKKKKKDNEVKLVVDTSKDQVPEGDTKPLLGTSKAVETMFRNALRTELDLIALAATKANIMISLNGIIISALMISGAFIFVSSAAFLVPAGMFMFTAAASIFFAILAASPEKAKYLKGFISWFKAFIKRDAHFRDLNGYLARANQTSLNGDINPLINKDRMQLSREEYWERMQILMRDRDETYHAMSDQLYWLGQIAARNFKMLNISYAIFRWGMLASVLASIFLKALLFFYPAAASDVPAQLDQNGMGTLTGVYEPSAVQQLPDGRVLVVEDEEQRAMNVMSVAPDGSLSENAVASLQLTRSFGRKLNDLEGLSADDKGFVYAITSHSADTSGVRDPTREQLLRFRVNGNIAGDVANINTLRDSLEKSPVIDTAFRAHTNASVNFDELDIEGLAYDNSKDSLMLGLRAPMAGKLSVIVPIINPEQMFTNNVAPVFGEPIFLDLNGGGIRSLYFDPVLGVFVIANEINDPAGNKEAQIWTWTGQAADKPVQVDTPELSPLKNIEAIDSITANGTIKMVFMADEGDAKKGIHARYMMLDYKKFTE